MRALTVEIPVVRVPMGNPAAQHHSEHLDLDKAEGMVADELRQIRSDMVPDERPTGNMQVDSQPVEWRAYVLPNGDISVGTIFLIK
jgi:hypothetical protein